jgi:hypothetical protein
MARVSLRSAWLRRVSGLRPASPVRLASAFRLPSSVFLLVLALAACGGPPREHLGLSANVEPLRSHFNRDAGHVRIVTLIAPT